MIISEALLISQEILKQKGIYSFRIDALILLCHSLNVSKEQVIFNPKLKIEEDKQQIFFTLIDRRCKKEPISQIINNREFFGINFIVNQHVLDPRPDSESVIESVLKFFNNKQTDLNILELGIGSGCLLLTILKELPNALGLGVDISVEALKIAQKNIEALNLTNQATLLHSNWFSNVPVDKKFDLIISNPPYIKKKDIAFLQEEVRSFEPEIALNGGEDGLECYRLISTNVKKFLKISGLLILEIGDKQEEEVINIFTKVGLKFIFSKQDLAGIVRSLVFKSI